MDLSAIFAATPAEDIASNRVRRPPAADRSAASARSCRQPPPTRQRSGHYHAATLWETPPNWQLPRQIAGTQGYAGRAGAEFSRAAPCLQSSHARVVVGWALYEATAAL